MLMARKNLQKGLMAMGERLIISMIKFSQSPSPLTIQIRLFMSQKVVLRGLVMG